MDGYDAMKLHQANPDFVSPGLPGHTQSGTDIASDWLERSTSPVNHTPSVIQDS
jgi:hypothetical protein